MSRQLKVLVCRGPSCGDARNSSRIADEFRRRLAERNLCNVEMAWQSCFGRCTRGPNVLVRAVTKETRANTFVLATPPRVSRGGGATMYNHVTPADVQDIVLEHLESGRPVRRLIEQAKAPQGTSDVPKPGQREKDGDT